MLHHCSARSKDKLEQLNKQALRVVLDDQGKRVTRQTTYGHIRTKENTEYVSYRI